MKKYQSFLYLFSTLFVTPFVALAHGDGDGHSDAIVDVPHPENRMKVLAVVVVVVLLMAVFVWWSRRKNVPPTPPPVTPA